MSVDCVLRSLVPAYSLGALDTEELARFESHLVAGCSACERELSESDRVATLLARSAQVVAPPACLRSRLMAEIGVDQKDAWSDFLSVGDWQPHKEPGVSRRVLQIDESARVITMIVRAEPGVTYPAHRHAASEQLLMLDGELWIGSAKHGPGDFIVSVPNSIHPPSNTPGGCMFLCRTSLDDELMPLREGADSQRPEKIKETKF